jgi:hypothetical protein
MKNGKVFIKNGQPYILPVSLVDGAWVGYVDGNTVVTPTPTPTPTSTPTYDTPSGQWYKETP